MDTIIKYLEDALTIAKNGNATPDSINSENVIYYGAPGTGKNQELQNKKK